MPVVTLAVTAPLPVPEAGLRDNQVVLALALQLKVPPPVLLMVRVCVAGLPPPCWAVKDRLVGLAPIAGLTESADIEIPAANFFIDRPPPPPLPEVDELPAPAAASGMVPVVVDVAAVLDAAVVTDDGAKVMVARGRAAPTLLISDDGSLD